MENIDKIRYRTLSHSFLTESQNQILTIEQIDKQELISIHLQKLCQDTDMLKGFSFDEIIRICFAAGVETANLPFKKYPEQAATSSLKNYLSRYYCATKRFFAAFHNP